MALCGRRACPAFLVEVPIKHVGVSEPRALRPLSLILFPAYLTSSTLTGQTLACFNITVTIDLKALEGQTSPEIDDA
jgi:hypothetical protein